MPKTIEQRAAELAAQWKPLTEKQLILLATTFRPAQGRSRGAACA